MLGADLVGLQGIGKSLSVGSNTLGLSKTARNSGDNFAGVKLSGSQGSGLSTRAQRSW